MRINLFHGSWWQHDFGRHVDYLSFFSVLETNLVAIGYKKKVT